MTDTATPAFKSEVTAQVETERLALWEAIRGAGEVYEAGGYWMFTSSEAVRFAQRNPDIFSTRHVGAEFEAPVLLIPGQLDPPVHRDVRSVLDPLLSPRAVRTYETELRQRAEELIDAFAARGHCDAVEELGVPFPTSAFLTVFGLPQGDRARLTELVETMIDNAPPSPPEAAELSLAAMRDLHAYIDQHVKTMRGKPGGRDLLSSILALEGDAAWSDDEIVGMGVLLVMAGLDTVAGASGFLLLHLARDPELRHRVAADRSLLVRLIEEVLRNDPPVPAFPRITTESVEVCGVQIPAGAKVLLWLACVNREVDGYASNDPDLDHTGRTHSTFGGGVHRCLGVHLARQELRILAEVFLDRIPEFEVEPGFVPSTAWPKGTLHLHSLPLRFPPAKG